MSQEEKIPSPPTESEETEPDEAPAPKKAKKKQEPEPTQPDTDEDRKYAKIAEAISVDVDQIKAWKKEFGRLGFVTIQGDPYLYHALSGDVWDKAVNSNTTGNMKASEVRAMNERNVVKYAILHPSYQEALDRKLAGVIPTLAQNVTQISGFLPDDEPIEL